MSILSIITHDDTSCPAQGIIVGPVIVPESDLMHSTWAENDKNLIVSGNAHAATMLSLPDFAPFMENNFSAKYGGSRKQDFNASNSPVAILSAEVSGRPRVWIVKN